MEKCKKCLLLEAGEQVTYDEIMQYVATIDKEMLADESVCAHRLAKCRQCDNLISGMCRKCGCYVEVRARLADSFCPDVDNTGW